MINLEKWINAATGVGVIMGIVFLGMEINQNTEMMQSQARDSITEKQMMFSEWVATEPEMAAALVAAGDGLDSMSPEHRIMYAYFMTGVFREWENSYYQYQRGLFDAPEFTPRMERWRSQMMAPSARATWKGTREWYAPGFRQTVDEIVRGIDAMPVDPAAGR